MTAGFEHKYDLGDVVQLNDESVQIYVIEIGAPLLGSDKNTIQYGAYVVNTKNFRWFYEHNLR